MGSSSEQTIGYKYYLGMHLALCHGPVDKIVRIQVDAKDAWVGEATGGQITINAEDLFGGTSREGGVSGAVDIEMGAATQGQNSYLVSKLGDLVPNFRGVCAAVLRQCYVGMNPYLKPWAFRAQRINVRNGGEAQWYDIKAEIKQASLTVNESWTEDFSEPETYTLIQGDSTAFEIDPGDGNIRVLPGPEMTHSVLRRGLTSIPWAIARIEFKVRLSSLPEDSDDCGEIAFYTTNGARLLSFGAARDSTADSLQRPIVCPAGVCTNNEEDKRLGTTHLTVGKDYQFTAIQAPGDTMICTLHDLSDGALFGTLVISAQSCTPDYIEFSADNYHNAGSSVFWDINLYSANYLVNTGDMNPAHIIRECLTDMDWGLGYQDADIDEAAFVVAANSLYDEEMGISLLWDRQIPIEDFIKEILKHIDAVLYVDRITGKFVLRLIRDNYDAETLLVLGEDNIARCEAFKAPALGELVNSVTVKYWDAVTGEDASLSVQDIALVQAQGTTISATSEYPGFTNGAIAQRVAARDLRALSTPLVSCTLYANRSASSLNVGDVFRLDWPDYGAANLIMRVTQIALGDGRNNQVRITCVQDVFGLPLAIHAPPVASEWTPPDLAPSPSPHHLAIEAPYYELVQRVGQSTVDSNLAERPDLGYLLVAGDRQGAEMNARIMVNAGAGYVDGGALDFAPYAALAEAVNHTAESWTITGGIDLDQIVLGTHAQIGMELVQVTSVSDTAISVKRGVLDTIPTTHAAGAQILFWDQFAATDEVEYVSGETLSVKILPSSGASTLSMPDAPADTLTFAQRAWRPYPPGRFQVNDAYWPENIGGTDALDLTWVHRDRSQQTDGSLYDYLAASIGPESGTAYALRVYGELGSLVHTETAVVGTSWSYAMATEADESGLSGDGTLIPGVVLCLNMNGTDGSTTFIDDTGKTVTATGAVEIDTAQSKFGGASGYFNGGYLTVPDSADWNFGTGDFTIELWARWPSNGNAIFACQDVDTSNIWFFKHYAPVSRLEVGVKNAGSWLLDAHDANWTPTNNTWHHLALCRSGNNLRIFVDGVQKGSTASYSGAFPDFSVPLKIGQTSNWSAYTTTAHFDGLRIIKGTALYTANFTPPNTAPATINPGTSRINGKLRVELESVRYAGGVSVMYAVPSLSGWDGSHWIGELGVEDTYFYQASADLSSYTALDLTLPYGKVATGGGILLAVSGNGTCKSSADGGATWTTKTGVSGLTYVSKLVYLDGKFILLGLGSSNVYYTADGGTTWSGVALPRRPLDIAYSGSTWMVVGANNASTNIPYVATASTLSGTWTDISPGLTNWHGSNIYASTLAASGTLQADAFCVVWDSAGSKFVVGGQFVTHIGTDDLFYPLVYKYASSTWTDCCPPMQGSFSAGGGFAVQSMVISGTKLIVGGFRTAAYTTLSTLSSSGWTPCTVPAGTLDSHVTVAGGGTSVVLTTHNGGANLISTDGITFAAGSGSVANNPVAAGPTGGITSWQHHDHTVYRAGYGFNYGMFYGGTP